MFILAVLLFLDVVRGSIFDVSTFNFCFDASRNMEFRQSLFDHQFDGVTRI
jgi:hypothetical protein